MRVIFQMDTPASLNRCRDSSILLINEALRREFEVFWYHPKDLMWHHNEVWVRGQEMKPKREDLSSWDCGATIFIKLENFDVLWIRQDPPFNMAYLTPTYLLEKLEARVCCVNAPSGLRQSPEKLLPLLYFSDEMPPTCLTSDLETAYAFAEAQGAIVVKPLYAAGGESIFMTTRDDPNFPVILETLSMLYPQQPWLLQAFLPQILSEGDRRLMLFDGEIIGGFTRAVPSQSIRSNIARGGVARAYVVTKEDRALCRRIAPVLRARGLRFVGLDVIGPYLIEVNVTSPGGLIDLNTLYGQTSEREVWDRLLETL